MRQHLVKLSVASLILTGVVAGGLIGGEARSAENRKFTDTSVPEGNRHYHHNSHFHTSIELPAGGTSTFPPSFTIDAQFTSTPPVTVPPTPVVTKKWPVYCKVMGKGRKKLYLVLVAQHPNGIGPVDSAAQVAGTGTILVQTTDPGGNTITGPPVPVEPIDGDPCP